MLGETRSYGGRLGCSSTRAQAVDPPTLDIDPQEPEIQQAHDIHHPTRIQQNPRLPALLSFSRNSLDPRLTLDCRTRLPVAFSPTYPLPFGSPYAARPGQNV